MSDGLSFYDWWAAHDAEKVQAVEDAYAIEQLLAECVPVRLPWWRRAIAAANRWALRFAGIADK